MGVPDLSDDDRRAALEKAARARRARADLKRQLRDGEISLADVLARADSDDVIGKTRVAAVLEAVPRVGKVTARRLMTELDISPSRRLRGLGVKQRERLLATFDEDRSG